MLDSDFTIPGLKRRFHLSIDEADDLFGQVAEADLPASLARFLPLALNLSIEKARSESSQATKAIAINRGISRGSSLDVRRPLWVAKFPPTIVTLTPRGCHHGDALAILQAGWYGGPRRVGGIPDPVASEDFGDLDGDAPG